MKQQQCKYCPQMIMWVETAKNHKPMCVELPTVIRHGSEPPPTASYYDEQGNYYKAEDVPVKMQVYRAHWGNCPGADKARKR